MPANNIIKMRRGTAAEWTSANPTLSAGEMGIETDTARSKFGDGTTAWTSLGYTVGDSSGVATVEWTSVQNKPTEFDPIAHAGDHGVAGSDPVTIAQSQVTDLATDLAGKAATVHTHLKEDITDFAHTHIAADITDITASATELNYTDGVTSAIQTQLDAKADVSALSSLDASVITTGEFGTTRLADSAVTEAKLATDSVTAEKIAAGAVGDSELASGIDATKMTGDADGLTLIRLSSTTDAGLTSTEHAFQVGADSGQNLLMDNNEIIVRNNGAVSGLSIQASGGDINIGTTSNGVGFGKDEAAGKIWANGVYDNTLTTSYRSMYVSATGTKDFLGYVPSSIRWKNNITPLSYTAAQILAIEPKEYNYKSEDAGSPKHVGMIAEDLHEAGLTGFVSYDEEGLPGSINYEFFVAALQQVVRHQSAQIADLSARLDSLES